MGSQVDSEEGYRHRLMHRHLRFGWWALLAFVLLGAVLEAMHGLKVAWYLEPAFETRRLMWTLGHAHGTLLAIANTMFGLTVLALRGHKSRLPRFASPCLLAATLLLPGGFFLGGIYTFQGDPGAGVFLVPFGALLLIGAVSLTAVFVTRWPYDDQVERETNATRRAGKGRR